MEDERFCDNYDTAIEILSRLPIESIALLKCTSKRWLRLLSDPCFINAHFQRSSVRNTISGLFIQGVTYCRGCKNYIDFPEVDYLSLQTKEEDGYYKLNRTTLDFLPEKVSVITSSNGILLCRSFFEMIYESHCRKRTPKEIVLYVCNPLTKEWTSFKPQGKFEKHCCFGFSYDPFGSTATLVNPTKTYPATFQVVMVQPPSKLGKHPYLFWVYSSETGKWKRSPEVCYLPNVDSLPNILYPHQSFFANGVCYWLTLGHTILSFDLKQERSQVIPIPGPKLIVAEDEGVCLGLSDGDLHFVCFNNYDLMIWLLKHDTSGCCGYKWVLKHSKPAREMQHHLFDFMNDMPDELSKTDETIRSNNRLIKPYVLHDDVLFINVGWIMCTYNIKTGLIEEDLYDTLKFDNSTFPTPIVLPYYKSLLQV